MPKASSSSYQLRFSPYLENLKKSKKNMGSSGEKDRQWEEARCPICMEHPHNAVLLICSSHGKGCRPYMCDTSRRHSNCFDQFCMLNSVAPSKSRRDDQPNKFVGCGEKKNLEFGCPLCRGRITGWVVEESARGYMNSMVRGCALETCDFSGDYGELRRHARLEHPLARPSEADKERLSDWDRRLEEELDEDYDEVEDDFCMDEDFEETGEVNLEPLEPGDDFFNHIHFGDENDTVLEEDFSIANGILTYRRTTTTGKYYEFATVLE